METRKSPPPPPSALLQGSIGNPRMRAGDARALVHAANGTRPVESAFARGFAWRKHINAGRGGSCSEPRQYNTVFLL